VERGGWGGQNNQGGAGLASKFQKGWVVFFRLQKKVGVFTDKKKVFGTERDERPEFWWDKCTLPLKKKKKTKGSPGRRGRKQREKYVNPRKKHTKAQTD